MSKIWRIPVTWEMCGIVEVESDKLEDAMDMVKKDDEIELPEGYYVDGSLDLSYLEIETVRAYYNNHQPDKEKDENDE